LFVLYSAGLYVQLVINSNYIIELYCLISDHIGTTWSNCVGSCQLYVIWLKGSCEHIGEFLGFRARKLKERRR